MCIASIILAYIRKRNSYFHPYIDCMIFAQNTIHKMLQNIQFFILMHDLLSTTLLDCR